MRRETLLPCGLPGRKRVARPDEEVPFTFEIGGATRKQAVVQRFRSRGVTRYSEAKTKTLEELKVDEAAQIVSHAALCAAVNDLRKGLVTVPALEELTDSRTLAFGSFLRGGMLMH